MEEKINFRKLLAGFEGKELPADMRAWFTLAKEARSIQLQLDMVEDQIHMLQKELKNELTRKQHLLNSERELMKGMDKVFPQGGDKPWENLS